ncbi:MAG: hypothetical protein IKJ65_10925 [Clostridia bacterium]|nr:hypothetical protein [Clostridia bacterium]
MEKYDDIIELKYPLAHTRRQMSASDRAAQFSPFAALNGYDEAIDETARLTEPKAVLSEDEQNEIGDKLFYLKENLSLQPWVRIVFFVPDPFKSGGKYLTVQGKVKKVREFEKSILLLGGEEISFDDILFIDTETEKDLLTE